MIFHDFLEVSLDPSPRGRYDIFIKKPCQSQGPWKIGTTFGQESSALTITWPRATNLVCLVALSLGPCHPCPLNMYMWIDVSCYPHITCSTSRHSNPNCLPTILSKLHQCLWAQSLFKNPTTITLFRSITMFCGIDSIMHNVSHL